MTIARLSWLRLVRGRAKWVSGVLALLPPILALAMQLGPQNEDAREQWQITAYAALQWPVLLGTVLHLASTVGDELEARTYTYLWSRPMPRRALLFGKLVGTLPLVTALFTLSVSITWAIIWREDPGGHLVELARGIGGVLAAIVASAALALAIGTFFPKHPLALALVYLLLGDQLMGLVPAVQQIAVSYHAAAISGARPPGSEVGALGDGVIGTVVLTVIWLSLAVWRVERAEYALPDG